MCKKGYPPQKKFTTPDYTWVKQDIDHNRQPPHRISTTPDIFTSDIHHALCVKKGHPPHQTLTRLDIHHTMRKIGHPPHQTSITPDIHQTRPFFTRSVWWMSFFYTQCVVGVVQSIAASMCLFLLLQILLRMLCRMLELPSSSSWASPCT